MTTLNFTASATAAQINQAIRNADDGPLTINLAAGTYLLEESINILRSDVTLTGAGIGKTILKTASATGGNAQAIKVQGSLETEVSTLKTSTVADGTTKIVLNSAAGITAGMVIKITQENDAAYFKASGNTHLDPAAKNDAGQYLRQMLAEVVKVEGNSVTLKTKTPYAFTGSDANGATTAKVTIPALLTGIEMSDFSITSDLAGTPRSTDFENRYAQYENSDINSAVEITGVRGLELHDVATTNTASTAFSFSKIYGSTIDSLTATGTFNKGAEGNGYAFLLKTAFNNTLTNLTDKDMRHSVITGSFTPEHYNKIHVLSTNRDINFHGSADASNTYVIDNAVLSTGSEIRRVVQPGNADIHPKSTIEKNDVTFKYLKASTGNDEVTGHSGGSQLYGMQGKDKLHGGKGKDYLDGGVDNDVLDGGAGADTFVFRRGYGLDTILDFQSGSSGDTLDLANTGVTARADLAARHTGGDTIISFGGGNSVTLKGIDKTEYAAMKIKFSSTEITSGASVTAWAADTGFIGTSGSDTFSLRQDNFTKKPDLIGMKGQDTVQMISGTAFGVDKIGKSRGIDIVDMTKATKKATVALDKAFAGQADKDYVTVKFGKAGLFLDTGDVTNWSDVRISGTGQVTLSSKGAVVSAAGSQAINVVGGAKIDKIKGGAGNDRIDGGQGRDILQGGGGDDTFVFSKTAGSAAADVINDFSNAKGNDDRIAIDNAAWTGLKDGWLTSSAFKLVDGRPGKADMDSNDRVFYDKAAGDIWIDRDGSGLKYSQIKLAEVDDGTSLTYKDFFIL